MWLGLATGTRMRLSTVSPATQGPLWEERRMPPRHPPRPRCTRAANAHSAAGSTLHMGLHGACARWRTRFP